MRLLLVILWSMVFFTLSGFEAVGILFFRFLGARRFADYERTRYATTWGRLLPRLAGGKVEVIGQENIPEERTICVVANHQSYMDIPLLLGALGIPLGFIAKKELLAMPVINFWMPLMGSVMIDRKDMRQSRLVIEKGAASIASGKPLIIFPEGTRSKGRPIAEFKAGSLKLATSCGATILPVSIDGGWQLLERPENPFPAKVRVTIHPPVSTVGLGREEQKQLAPRLQQLISSQVKLVSASAGPESAEN